MLIKMKFHLISSLLRSLKPPSPEPVLKIKCCVNTIPSIRGHLSAFKGQQDILTQYTLTFIQPSAE